MAATPADFSAARFVVNRATSGMSTQIRWMLSPDSSALLVVDDPSGAEGDPVPDAVLYASERAGRVWQMDSVWSIAPSPDWARVAVGRAVVLRSGEEQRIDPARWSDAAASLAQVAGPQPALVADSLRAHAFSTSGMAVMEGVAATYVADVDAKAEIVPLRFVALGGWTLGWSADGADLIVGDRPVRTADDAAAAHEVRVSAHGGGSSGAAAAKPLVWLTVPTLAVGELVSRTSDVQLRVRGRSIVGRGGRVVVMTRDAAGREVVRDVGPGEPLAATRGGHFVLALAPRVGAKEYEAAEETVVYRVP